VTLMSKSQLSKGGEQVRATAVKARRQARQRAGMAATKAAAQAAPLAVSAKLTARQGVHSVRAWAAPRLEQSGQALEKKVAPKMSAMLLSAARKIEPRRTRRRWPFFVGGLVALGAAAGAAAVGWRSSQTKSQQQTGAVTGEPESATAPAGESNAKVRTT
jgi:hypothetical protein